MPSSPATILIVDDEQRARKGLEGYLAPEGHIVHTVGSGEDALDFLQHTHPDLIFLDIVMPGMDGYEVASRIRADPKTAHLTIIMITGKATQSARLAGLKAGALDFLYKPIGKEEVVLKVRNWLAMKELATFHKEHSRLLERQVAQRTVQLQRFRTAMDATADAIFLTDRATMRFVEVNATACALLGYSEDELLQMGPYMLGAGPLQDLAADFDRLIADPATRRDAEFQVPRKDGSLMQVEVHRKAQKFGDDWLIVSVARDISDRKAVEKRLHQLAHFDALTGLANRSMFHESLRQCTEDNPPAHPWAVLFVDLDKFKDVNDTLGHDAGDQLLCQVAQRLQDCVRSHDTVGRLGGDEFAILIGLRASHRGAEHVAQKILAALARPFHIKGHVVRIGASVGITLFPADATCPHTLLKYADTAMYQAKQAGRNTYRFFTARMNKEVTSRLELEAAIRRAVEKEEFILHYQPKVELRHGQVVGLEALLRWARPGVPQLVLPNVFVPVLEDMGLIGPVGKWVLATACKHISAWRRAGLGSIPVSVNVSSKQFTKASLETEIAKSLANYALSPELLEVELTESSLMVDIERTNLSLQRLKALGVKISIDDFGTGYSSLAYLRHFPIDKLKIDIAFIRDIATSPQDARIAQAIIHMGQSLGLTVIAEGVETQQQITALKRYRCHQVQGNFFSKPLSFADVRIFLEAHPLETKPVHRAPIARRPVSPLPATGEATTTLPLASAGETKVC